MTRISQWLTWRHDYPHILTFYKAEPHLKTIHIFCLCLYLLFIAYNTNQHIMDNSIPNYMEQSSIWESNSRSASRLLWNPKFNCPARKCPPLIIFLRQMNPFRCKTFITCYCFMETGCYANLKAGWTVLVGCPSTYSQLPFISGDCVYQHPYGGPYQSISWTVEHK
jgi:hypothetical protein